MEKYKLITAKGSGGAIIELLLEKSMLPFEIERLEWDQLTAPNYTKVNPIGQVPSMVLPNGEVMTESLAIATYINEVAGLGLVPKPDSSIYASYLRWSTFLVGTVYPTFTYSDNPNRYVTGEAAGAELKMKIDEFRKRQWLVMEGAAKASPHFLGPQETLIDYYLSCMVYWRPGIKWFEENTPKLLRCARQLQDSPVYQKVYKANN